MPKFNLFIFFIVSIAILITPRAGADASGFAVVELFTSEGCSSCPPADQLLREITQKAKEENLTIYTLGFHVDYWNYLGWEDVFSQKDYSRRQYQYAQAMQTTSVYTPQLIINGTKAFNGSDREQAWKTIHQALQKPSSLKLNLSIAEKSANTYELSYQISSIPPDSTLNFALVEKNLKSNVSRGENTGRLLQHDNVVRFFNTTDIKAPEHKITFSINNQWKKEDLAVIAYIQNKKDTMIVAAAQTGLNR